MEVRKVAEEWEIWDEEEEAAKPEAEIKKLVPEKFYKWIKCQARFTPGWKSTECTRR